MILPSVAAWSSGGNLGTGRYSRACFGTQNEAVFAGGGPPNGTLTNTEEYDGGSWATGGALSVARRNLAGCAVDKPSVILALRLGETKRKGDDEARNQRSKDIEGQGDKETKGNKKHET